MVKLRSSKPSLWVRIPLPLLALLMWSLLYKFFSVLRNIINQNTYLNTLILLILNWFLVIFRVNKVNGVSSHEGITQFEFYKMLAFKGVFWYFLDLFYFYFLSLYLNLKRKTRESNFNFKLSQLDNNSFYMFNNVYGVNSALQTSLFGLRSIWKHIRFWVLPVTIALLFCYYSFFLKSLPFSKVMFSYILIGNMFYLLFSGFVFFIKKYQYRLYTSAIQRFWRRTLIIFWALEAFLFVIFLYLILNANQEPVYVYDNVQLYKTHFYSWRYFLLKIFLSALLVVLTYTLLLSLKWNTFTKTNNISLLITVILLYISWLEFYQLFHLMNCYGTSNWVYDFSEHLWNLELEFKRTRIVNHYVTIGLVAKFWHVVFAVVFWIFFILRGLESSRYRYPLLSANLQNFLIIYIMSWLYMYPWFKYVARKAMDMPYYWFFVNNRKLAVFLFFNDIKLYFFGFLDYIYNLRGLNFFRNNSFFYWHESTIVLGNTQFRKHNIRDLFVRAIN